MLPRGCNICGPYTWYTTCWSCRQSLADQSSQCHGVDYHDANQFESEPTRWQCLETAVSSVGYCFEHHQLWLDETIEELEVQDEIMFANSEN